MRSEPSQLQRELHQGRPFRSTAQESLIALFRTADMIQRLFERSIEPHGITTQQYNVLRILRGAGPNGLPTLSIAERMIQRAPGITRLLDRLESRNLVERSRCAEDRRQVICRISPAGLELLAGLDEVVDRIDGEALGMLTEAQQEQLLELLDAIRAGL
jgi:MarR family transcriptional regulator, organic hydroperoxide resistance regulator